MAKITMWTDYCQSRWQSYPKKSWSVKSAGLHAPVKGFFWTSALPIKFYTSYNCCVEGAAGFEVIKNAWISQKVRKQTWSKIGSNKILVRTRSWYRKIRGLCVAVGKIHYLMLQCYFLSALRLCLNPPHSSTHTIVKGYFGNLAESWHECTKVSQI